MTYNFFTLKKFDKFWENYVLLNIIYQIEYHFIMKMHLLVKSLLESIIYLYYIICRIDIFNVMKSFKNRLKIIN